MGSRSVDSLLNGFVEQMRKNSPQWSDSNKAGGSSTSAAVDRTILEDQISISLMTSPVAELLDDRVKGMILDPQSWPEYNAPGTTGDTLRYSWAGLADPHFRFRRTRRLPDNGREEPIHQFADNVFYCLLDLFVFTALQLWHDAERIIPKENFETNFNSALELLMSLQLLSKHEYIHKMNEITPNFTIIGLNKGIDDTIPKDNTGRSPLATLKMKSVDIIEKVYEEKLLVSSQFTGNNKDDFMTKLAAQGRTLKDTEGELRRKGFGENSWADDTLKVLAQMHVQASSTASKMGLCTCIYGFLRACEVKPGPIGSLSLSPNHMRKHKGSDGARTDPAGNREFIERVFSFLVRAIVKSYGSAIIPEEAGLISTEFFTSTFSVWSYLSCARTLTAKWRAALLSRTWENVIKLGGPWVLADMGAFRVTFMGGQFQRADRSRSIATPYIHFELVSNNDGRLVSINKNLGLVLKTFFDKDVFENERAIYEILAENRLGFVPQLYGTYQNSWMRSFSLLISDVGEPIQDGFTQREWQQLHDAIETLHEVGIHHHDLKTDNVMRNSEGDIRVIDFSHAECCNDVDREVCPDWWWINGVRPDTL